MSRGRPLPIDEHVECAMRYFDGDDVSALAMRYQLGCEDRENALMRRIWGAVKAHNRKQEAIEHLEGMNPRIFTPPRNEHRRLDRCRSSLLNWYDAKERGQKVLPLQYVAMIMGHSEEALQKDLDRMLKNDPEIEEYRKGFGL